TIEFSNNTPTPPHTNHKASMQQAQVQQTVNTVTTKVKPLFTIRPPSCNLSAAATRIKLHTLNTTHKSPGEKAFFNTTQSQSILQIAS
ncbi:hypothetical protein, partial [Corynebacterium pseudotuberculosis]